MTPDTLLMFAYHFPPENAIGGVRPFRFFKYLSRSGLKCHVITAASGASTISPDAEAVPDVFEVRRGGVKWQIERAVRKVLLPGVTGTQWSFDAYEAGRAFLRANPRRHVAIFSTFPPLGPHLAAWRLARHTKLPLIADFRDPLADHFGYAVTPVTRPISRALEKQFVQTARIVLVNTDSAAERLCKLYPNCREKIQLIWNGFDPEERVRAIPAPQRAYKLVSHVGALYQGRTATPMLESVRRLIEAGHLKPETIRVRLVGGVSRDSMPPPGFIDRARTEGWLELTPEHVSQSEAHRIAASSDGLLLLQPQSTIQVPGKLFEYIQIGRPILAHVMRNSPVERILEKSGIPYRCAYADGDSADLDQAVKEFFMLIPGQGSPSPWFETQFNAQNQTAELYRLLGTLSFEMK